jgi:hypothetical protein
VPLTLTRPVVSPVVESRPDPRAWPAAVLTARPGQPALDLRPLDELAVLAGVPDPTEVPAGLPDAHAWGAALAVTLLEVLAGRRPAAQLSRWLEADVLTALTGRLPRRRPGAAAPAPTLRSVRVQHPAPGVAEVTVHGRLDDRSVPLALRLEARQGRWLGTALELGPLR